MALIFLASFIASYIQLSDVASEQGRAFVGAFIVSLVATAIGFGVCFFMLQSAIGPASPSLGLLLMFYFMGLAKIAQPLFRLRIPKTLRAVRAWEMSGPAYGRLAVDGFGWRPGTHQPPDGLQTMVDRGHVNWTGILFRRAALKTVPALDPETAPSFDLDFELRLAAACPFVVCSQPGALMVHHPGSATVAARLSDT